MRQASSSLLRPVRPDAHHIEDEATLIKHGVAQSLGADSRTCPPIRGQAGRHGAGVARRPHDADRRASRFGLLRSVPPAAVRAVIQPFAVPFIVVAAVTRLGRSCCSSSRCSSSWTTTGRVRSRSAPTISAGSRRYGDRLRHRRGPAERHIDRADRLHHHRQCDEDPTLNGQRASPRRARGARSSAALTLGSIRPETIGVVARPVAWESLMHPRHDTEGGSGDAPGAFIGVLLGGSTALQGRRRAGSRGQRDLAGGRWRCS